MSSHVTPRLLHGLESRHSSPPHPVGLLRLLVAIILAKAFLSRFADDKGTGIKGFDSNAIRAFDNYNWPGNVRELESRIKRAVIMAESGRVSAEDLELEDYLQDTIKAATEPPLNLRQVRETAEKKAIRQALAHSDDNISDAPAAGYFAAVIPVIVLLVRTLYLLL